MMASPRLSKVLAHLDFSIPKLKQPVPQEDAQRYTQKMLETVARSLDNRHTPKQIEQCLRDAARSEFTYLKDNIFQLFLHGSIELTKLDKDTKSAVSEELETLKLVAQSSATNKRELRSRRTSLVESTSSPAKRTARKSARYSSEQAAKQVNHRSLTPTNKRMVRPTLKE
jgi:hypothetical protein